MQQLHYRKRAVCSISSRNNNWEDVVWCGRVARDAAVASENVVRVHGMVTDLILSVSYEYILNFFIVVDYMINFNTIYVM